jgi:hypothetical protein
MHNLPTPHFPPGIVCAKVQCLDCGITAKVFKSGLKPTYYTPNGQSLQKTPPCGNKKEKQTTVLPYRKYRSISHKFNIKEEAKHTEQYFVESCECGVTRVRYRKTNYIAYYHENGALKAGVPRSCTRHDLKTTSDES